MKILWNRVVVTIIIIGSIISYGIMTTNSTQRQSVKQIAFFDCDRIGCWALPATECRITQDSYWCATTGGGGSGVKPM